MFFEQTVAQIFWVQIRKPRKFMYNVKLLLIIIITTVLQVIGGCTQQEWCYIWDSQYNEDLVKLETFYDAIGTMTLAERHHRTENSFACLLYCYRNFVYIIRVRNNYLF